MAVVTAILSRYPEEVITAVTHPVSGLPVKCSWVPTAKEVKDACEAAVLPIRSQQDREKRIAEQMRLRREEDESRAGKPSYAQLKAKHGDDWGIKQPKVATDPEDEKRARQRTERAILAEYAARGIEPQYTKSGDLISLSLARQIAGTQELADHIDDGFSPGSV